MRKMTTYLFTAFLSMTISHTYTMEPLPHSLTRINKQIISPHISQWFYNNPFIKNIAHLLLGVGDLNTVWQRSGNFAFMDLPEDIKNYIIGLIAAGSTSTTLEEAAKSINALATTNKELNTLINDPVFSLNLVKHLVKKFNSCEEDVCLAVYTKATKDYLSANIPLKTMMHHRLHFFPQGLLDNNPLLDFNFRFDSVGIDSNEHIITPVIPGGGNILMYAYYYNERILQSFLQQQPGIDINLPNKEGKTALMIAINGRRIPGHLPAIEFLKNYPLVNINQQDFKGNTALLIALETSRIIHNKTVITPGANIFLPTYIKKEVKPKAFIIRDLLKAGADPELANNEGLTPLQAAKNTNNNKIIQLISDAITKKNKTQ